MEDWFAQAVRGAVATAQAVKVSLATSSTGEVLEVVHAPWIGPGRDTYGPPTARQALVQRGAKLQGGPGQVQVEGTRVEFLGTVEPNGAAGRKEPVDPRDLLTLPGDTVPGHILEVPGVLLDPETGLPFVNVVWLA